MVEAARFRRRADVEVQAVGPGLDGALDIARMAAHVRQQKRVALLRDEAIAHGAQRGPILALLRADQRREQFDELHAVDDQRADDFFLVGAREEILVMVVQQRGLLAVAQRRVDDLQRARHSIG